MTHNDDDGGFDQPRLDELITLRETVEFSGLSASHLRLLVSRGELWGVKLGRNWEDSHGRVQWQYRRMLRLSSHARMLFVKQLVG